MMLRTRKRYSLAFLSVIAVMIVTMMVSTFSVFAETKANATVDKQAERQLQTYVYGKMSQNEYEVSGGGTKSGTDLFEGSATDGYDLSEKEFKTLTGSAQTEVVGDIAENSNEAVGNKDAEGVTDETVQNWWKELQTKDGVGSKFLNEILKNTKPDFVTANLIYLPFSGLIGTIMGLFAVATMGLLGIVITADIMYIVIPPFRLFVSDGDGDGEKTPRSKVFSHAAIYAVQTAEEDTGKGGGKMALGIYLKKQGLSLFILGICLLYLVQGQIYVAVGWILDLVSGFLGF